MILQDEDRTSVYAGGWRRLNTLAHYGVRDSAVMTLVPRQSLGPAPAYASLNAKSCKNCELILFHNYISLLTVVYPGNGSTYSFSRPMSPVFLSGCGDMDSPRGGLLAHTHAPSPPGSLTLGPQAFHIARPEEGKNHNARKSVPEIFLTRLLSTKGGHRCKLESIPLESTCPPI